MGTICAPWKQLLLNALESHSHLKFYSYFQLATIGTNGRPSNRTVVFRGFQGNSDKIQITTDSRSRKIEELKNCSFAEICWYFTDSWEQFRISGRIDIIDASSPDPVMLQERENSWFSVSLNARLQFLGVHPGLPYLTEQPSEGGFQDPSTGPVDTFCLLTLDPDQVDYLNQKSKQRFLFKFQPSIGGEKLWTSERINL